MLTQSSLPSLRPACCGTSVSCQGQVRLRRVFYSNRVTWGHWAVLCSWAATRGNQGDLGPLLIISVSLATETWRPAQRASAVCKLVSVCRAAPRCFKPASCIRSVIGWSKQTRGDNVRGSWGLTAPIISVLLLLGWDFGGVLMIGPAQFSLLEWRGKKENNNHYKPRSNRKTTACVFKNNQWTCFLSVSYPYCWYNRRLWHSQICTVILFLQP